MVRISIIYSWFVRTITLLLPNMPIFMRFRGFLYSLMMKKCGKNFQPSATVIFNSLAGLSVGNNVYIAHNVVVIGTDITIEDEVLIGPNCVISGGNHTFSNGSYRFGKSQMIPVVIRKGSWIAGNCTVTGGSILPAQSVLAAGAVLNKPMEQERSLYAGTPAKLIKAL